MLLQKFVSACFIVILVCFQANSQVYFHRNFTTEHGLSSNTTYDVTQDKEGRIWVATDNGVSYFDGDIFRNYTVDDGLPDAEIFNLHVDKEDRIWMLGSNGKISFFHHGKIVSERINQGLLRLNNEEKTWQRGFGMDASGNYWMVNQTGYFKKFRIDQRDSISLLDSGLISGQIRSEILIDEQGKAWIIAKLGLVCLSENPLKVKFPFQFDNAALGIATYFKNHLIYLKDNQLKGVLLPGGKEVFSISKSTSKEFIKLDFDLQGNLWASDLDSVYFVENLLLNVKAKLKPMQIGHKTGGFYFDKQNRIWTTSLSRGLFYYPNLQILSYTELMPENEGVISMLRKSDGSIVCSGLGAKVAYFSKNKSPKPDNRFLVNLRGRSKMKVYPSRIPGQIFFGGENGLFTMNDGTITGYFPFGVKALVETDSMLWIGSSTTAFRLPKLGLSKFKMPVPKGFSVPENAFLQFIGQRSVLPGKRIFDMDSDLQGNIWFATNRGIFKFHEKEGRSLPAMNGSDICFRHASALKIWKGNIVVFASKGIGLSFLSENKVFTLPFMKYFQGADIQRIRIYNDSLIWLCTANGLFYLRPIEGHLKFQIGKITTQNGLISNAVNDVWADADEIVVASDLGLTYLPTHLAFKKSDHALVPFNPTLTINGQQVSKVEVRIANLIENATKIELSWGCLDFESYGLHAFRYRLNGREWTKTSQFKATFSNLAAGSYSPELQAKIEGEKWGSVVQFPAFEILPVWWKRTWFLLLVFISGLFLAVGIVAAILKEKHEKELLDMNLIEANLKALRAQIKPHFIFNAINAVQYFFLNNRHEDGLEFLSKFSHLIRRILEGSEKQFHSLEAEINLIEHYLSIEKERIGLGLKVSFDIEQNIDKMKLEVPTMMIQPIVENAIWHGIGKKELPEGEILIQIKTSCVSKGQSMAKLLISITDDGVGMKPKADKVGSKTSFGLKSLQHKLELLNKKYNTTAYLQVRSPAFVEAKYPGTRIELELPIHWNKI